MAVLIKIKKGIGEKAIQCPDFGCFGSLAIGGSSYYLFTPTQAAALQKIGARLEFYQSGGHIYAPLNEAKLEKADIRPLAHDAEELERLVERLGAYIKNA